MVFLEYLLTLWQVTCQVGRCSHFFSLAPAQLFLMVPLVQGGVLGFLPGQVMTSLTSRCWCFSFLLQLITRNPQTLSTSPALTGTISPRASTPGLWGALVSMAYLAPPPVLVSPVTPDHTDSGHTLDPNLCFISKVGLLSPA